jgi:hypothetical protein
MIWHWKNWYTCTYDQKQSQFEGTRELYSPPNLYVSCYTYYGQFRMQYNFIMLCYYSLGNNKEKMFSREITTISRQHGSRKHCPPRLGFERATFDLLDRRSTNWATRSGWSIVILRNSRVETQPRWAGFSALWLSLCFGKRQLNSHGTNIRHFVLSGAE